VTEHTTSPCSEVVFGVALGFGAQSPVRDFLNGFFVLFEHQVSAPVRPSRRDEVERELRRRIATRFESVPQDVKLDSRD